MGCGMCVSIWFGGRGRLVFGGEHYGQDPKTAGRVLGRLATEFHLLVSIVVDLPESALAVGSREAAEIMFAVRVVSGLKI